MTFSRSRCALGPTRSNFIATYHLLGPCNTPYNSNGYLTIIKFKTENVTRASWNGFPDVKGSLDVIGHILGFDSATILVSRQNALLVRVVVLI